MEWFTWVWDLKRHITGLGPRGELYVPFLNLGTYDRIGQLCVLHQCLGGMMEDAQTLEGMMDYES